MSEHGAKRVVAYVRISRDTDESTSIDRQRQITADYAERHGLTLVDTVPDRTMSASKRRLDRPGLTRVRQLLADGEAEAVLVWRLDRLARSVVDMGTLLDEGLQIISCTEPLDTTTPMGRAMVEILQVFAALESSTIGERVKSARDYLVGQQRHPGGAVPYGYTTIPHPSGQGRALAVDPVEAGHVRAAADHVLSGGSLYSALDLLKSRGSTPRRAEAWSLGSLRVVLTGDAILGRLTHRGSVVRDASGLPVQPWEPVLPLGDVERLRALLAPKPAEDRRRRATRLLSGLVVCDGCGGRMRVASTKQRNGRDVLRYACRAKADGRVCPHPTSVTCEGLEGWVEAGFLAVAGDQPMRQPVATIREAPELAEVTAALADLGQAISRPGADVAALAAQIGELHQRRAVLDAVPAEPVVEYVETGLTYAEYWEALDDVAERRDMLRASGYLPVRIKPGQPGRKGLDAKRVVLSDAYRAQGTDFGTWERSRRRGRRARTGG